MHSNVKSSYYSNLNKNSVFSWSRYENLVYAVPAMRSKIYDLIEDDFSEENNNNNYMENLDIERLQQRRNSIVAQLRRSEYSNNTSTRHHHHYTSTRPRKFQVS